MSSNPVIRVGFTQKQNAALVQSTGAVNIQGPPGPPGAHGDPGVVVSPTPPTDHTVLWIDSSGL